jgi:TfoX/Sxy family transcriptional regulator of competence genes
MATDQKFVDFVLDQIENVGEVTARKMFGEYTVYGYGKIFALVCDNKLFIKPTAGGKAFMKKVVEAPPYPGAKMCFLIEDKIEDRTWLSNLIRITLEELPEPKPKKKKARTEKKHGK